MRSRLSASAFDLFKTSAEGKPSLPRRPALWWPGIVTAAPMGFYALKENL